MGNRNLHILAVMTFTRFWEQNRRNSAGEVRADTMAYGVSRPICPVSSAGRAYALQAWGRRFKPVTGHHNMWVWCLMVSISVFQTEGAGSSPAIYSIYAGMAELADAPDLGSGGLSCAGSTPVTRTIKSTYSNFIHGINF